MWLEGKEALARKVPAVRYRAGCFSIAPGRFAFEQVFWVGWQSESWSEPGEVEKRAVRSVVVRVLSNKGAFISLCLLRMLDFFVQW